MVKRTYQYQWGIPPVVINTRLANPNAPTAANGNGDYEQTGNSLPRLGQAVETKDFASLPMHREYASS